MGMVERLRAGIGPVAWGRALEYARGGAVTCTLLKRGEEEGWIVQPPQVATTFAVTVLLPEEDWECSCDAEACPHAAAVAIHRSENAVTPAPAATVAAIETRYALRRAGGVLVFERTVPVGYTTRDVRERALWELLDGSWGQAVRIPTGTTSDVPPRALVLLHAMERPLTLDGTPVRYERTPVAHRLRVDAFHDGVRVSLVRASGVDEWFVPQGLARVGDTLRPIADDGLDVGQRQRFIEGAAFRGEDLDRLVHEILPRLRRTLEVDVRTDALPERVEAAPRIAFEVETVPARDGRAETRRLRVRPRIAYGDPPFAWVDGANLVRTANKLPARDRAREIELQQGLRPYNLTLGHPVDWSGTGAATWVRRLPAEWRAQIEAAAPWVRVSERPVEVTLSVTPDGDGHRIRLEGGDVDPAALVRAWRAGETLVPLLAGGWAPLPEAWLDAHGDALAELLDARDSKGRVPRTAAGLLAETLEALNQPLPADLARLRASLGDAELLPAVTLPDDVHATLRPYQERGVAWLRWLRGIGMGGLLADDMGLGKTLQTLVALRLAHVVGAKHLVVVPTSVLRNWASEAARFVPSLRVCVYHGAKRTLTPDADVVVTSYALLRLDLDVLRRRRWTTVVLDEAHTIKNPESQVAQAAYALDAEQRLALSGTPVENRLDELWSAFHFVNPGLLGGRETFHERFGQPIADGNRHARDALRRRIRPFVLRRLKREVAKDLPPRTDIVLRCQLSTGERALYERVKALGRNDVARLLQGGGMIQVLEVLLRMRQACCHPALVPGGEPTGGAGSAKLELLCDTLGELQAEGHRALVFSQWTGMLDQVGPALTERGIPWTRLDGATRDRAAVVADFNRPDGPTVFLISLKAGGTGLNLTAADYVFHLDPWWNPAVEDQATDRAHRIGQDKPVVSCRIIAEDTVEERILELQARKRTLAAAALDEETLAQGVTRDELLALFD
jgi:hypothetical protein